MKSEDQFEKLVIWGREQRPRIFVHRRPVAVCPGPDGEAWVDQNGNGQVNVWVAPTDTNLPVLAAHEVGHARRELAGLMSQTYLEARVAIGRGEPKLAARVLSLKARRLVLEEEELAWDGGREVLTELGFDDWALFGRTRDHRLGVYLEILSLEAA